MAIKNSKFVEVYSITLLKKLSNAKLLHYLCFVKNAQDENGKPYIYFLFFNIRAVQKVVEDFNAEYGSDNRKIDGDLWNDFNPERRKNRDIKEIKTGNLYIVNRAIESNLAFDLMYIFNDEKRQFVFLESEELKKIKQEEDAKMRIRFNSQNNTSEKERTI